jgi:hypothetical protein
MLVISAKRGRPGWLEESGGGMKNVMALRYEKDIEAGTIIFTEKMHQIITNDLLQPIR